MDLFVQMMSMPLTESELVDYYCGCSSYMTGFREESCQTVHEILDQQVRVVTHRVTGFELLLILYSSASTIVVKDP
jgi:hypothetical protein